MRYIIIENQGGDPAVLPLNTEEETNHARQCLRQSGIDSATVYAGYPEGEDGVATENILEAL